MSLDLVATPEIEGNYSRFCLKAWNQVSGILASSRCARLNRRNSHSRLEIKKCFSLTFGLGAKSQILFKGWLDIFDASDFRACWKLSALKLTRLWTRSPRLNHMEVSTTHRSGKEQSNTRRSLSWCLSDFWNLRCSFKLVNGNRFDSGNTILYWGCA